MIRISVDMRHSAIVDCGSDLWDSQHSIAQGVSLATRDDGNVPGSFQSPAHALRPATDADVEAIQQIVYEAISWNASAEFPPLETIIDHPELIRYHGGWGRPGDAGVLADAGGEVVAGAFYRLFTEADHGQGYIDADTPEVAVAVWGAPKGKGVGSTLLDALHEMARNAGFAKVSLAVDSDNPAMRLYERQGYVGESVDEGDTLMVKNL